MRRATTLVLVLTGATGAAIVGPMLARPSQACLDARAAGAANAVQICRSGGSGGHSSGSHSSAYGRSTSSSSVARGGFGGTGAAMAAGG